MNKTDEQLINDIFSRAHKSYTRDSISIHDTDELLKSIKDLCERYPEDDEIQCNMNLAAARICTVNRSRDAAIKHLEISRKHIEPSLLIIIELHEKDERINPK